MAGSILYGDNSFEAPWDIDPDASGLDDNDPATNVIALPSALSLTGELRNVQALREGELELRRGQANEVLATIRQIVGQLSFQWVKGVRLAPDKARVTRARKSIQTVHRRLALQSQLYRHIRSAMATLGMDAGELDTIYQPLSAADISVSKAIKEPNERGASQTQLSWIWTTFPGVTEDQNYLTECTYARSDT